MPQFTHSGLESESYAGYLQCMYVLILSLGNSTIIVCIHIYLRYSLNRYAILRVSKYSTSSYLRAQCSHKIHEVTLSFIISFTIVT